ncbi:hypothetical protein M407DRAFT_244747 [Tulasnella calospora MUT 4182]|uniref:Rho GDP-dissociation inhibitor n=1 Tax=Tulasnella calospora MUT 4182 TaxID=1051891 RepID=A0A0C3KQ43_9AGAM|nr:hypothetical protein M407DRAFT_244747 [Tulasnella calospora MUT 4182]
MSAHDDDADLQPTVGGSANLGVKKTLAEYAELDGQDESLAKWKASLGIKPSAAAGTSGPQFTLLGLFIHFPASPEGKTIEIGLGDSAAPVHIKEGVKHSIRIRFQVNEIVTGLRYIHIVTRWGVKVDKMESMIGSYGPRSDGPNEITLPAEESPSGMLARGTYAVKSKIIDDDKQVHKEFNWSFEVTEE